jgi:hypothetical protein
VPKQNEARTIRIRVPDTVHAAVFNEAAARGETISLICREALLFYFAMFKKTGGQAPMLIAVAEQLERELRAERRTKRRAAPSGRRGRRSLNGRLPIV